MSETSGTEHLTDHMDPYRIQSVPSSMYYVPNFISIEEEDTILGKIPANKWVTLSKRRLQAIPSRLSTTNTLLASPLPAWLTDPIIPRMNDLHIFRGAPHGVNHCLVNEYLPGQGIFPHEDGNAYHPVVATVSLGGSIVLDVTSKASGEDGDAQQRHWRILQEPRSLLVTTGAAYADTLHGIAEVADDVDLNARTVANWSLLGDSKAVAVNQGRNVRQTRISLTYRDVKKVSNVGSKIFGKPRG